MENQAKFVYYQYKFYKNITLHILEIILDIHKLKKNVSVKKSDQKDLKGFTINTIFFLMLI